LIRPLHFAVDLYGLLIRPPAFRRRLAWCRQYFAQKSDLSSSYPPPPKHKICLTNNKI
jgi:hypothetical protein